MKTLGLPCPMMSWHFSCATVNLPTETFLDGLATLGRKQENNEHADNGYERHLMRQTFINSHLYVNDPLEIVCSCWQWHFTSITVKLSRRKINWNRSQIWLEIKNRSQIWPMTDGFTSISDFLPFHQQLIELAHAHCTGIKAIFFISWCWGVISDAGIECTRCTVINKKKVHWVQGWSWGVELSLCNCAPRASLSGLDSTQ